LETYLTDAVRFETLAESEGMKRFLSKDQGLAKSPGERGKAFGWPTPETFGKLGGNMIDVLAKAPKEVAGGVTGGGKAFFGNVAGLVKRAPQPAQVSRTNSAAKVPTSPGYKAVATEGRHLSTSTSTGENAMGPFMTDTYLGSMSNEHQSQESVRSMPLSLAKRRDSSATMASLDAKTKSAMSSQRPSVDVAPSSQTEFPPISGIDETFNLPPPPSDIPDDYGSPARSIRPSIDTFRSSNLDQSTPASSDLEDPPPPPMPQRPEKTAKHTKSPLTEQETAVAVELIFAMITELYTLSSAWQIRRTLLTAAKTFLLRPGNPQLASIRDLLQASLVDANLSDTGMAGHIYKLRENALPTAEEMEIWVRDFPGKTNEEKEALRVKARKLLVTKGMPQALTSVMGAAASGEALGKVFDCLQVEDVSRGLVFGLMLQALKVLTH
jgi:hypothetical protein